MKKIAWILLLLVTFQNAFTQEVKNDSKKIFSTNTSAMIGLRTVIYQVGDMDKAKEWYSNAFKAKPYFVESFYVGFNIGGYELGLQLEEEPIIKRTESAVAYWGVDDIEKEYERLMALGAIENEKPYNVGSDITTATVIDPWGNVIGLIYNPGFKIQK